MSWFSAKPWSGLAPVKGSGHVEADPSADDADAELEADDVTAALSSGAAGASAAAGAAAASSSGFHDFLDKSFLGLPFNRALVLSIAMPLGLGMASGFVTRTSVKTWYKDLKKPELVPPNYLFPIAWTTLYICMGYASYRVYNTYTPRTILESGPLKLYLAQLTLNLLWSPLFFYYKRVRWAMIDISALWFLVAATGVSFFRRDKLAGYLMIPYAIWVSFASYLNWGVLTLNPEWADGGPKKNQ